MQHADEIREVLAEYVVERAEIAESRDRVGKALGLIKTEDQ